MGDPAYLIVADDKVASTEGTLEIISIGQVHTTSERQPAGKHVPVRRDCPNIDVSRIPFEQAGEQGIGLVDIMLAHRGKMRKDGKQLMALVELALILEDDRPEEPKGVFLDLPGHQIFL